MKLRPKEDDVKHQLMTLIVEREDLKMEIFNTCVQLREVIGDHPLISDATSGKSSFNPLTLMNKLGSLGELKSQIPQVKALFGLLSQYAASIESQLSVLTKHTINQLDEGAINE